MGIIRGERTVEIDAPVDRVFAIAADIEHAPEAYTSRLSMDGLKSLVQFAGVDSA